MDSKGKPSLTEFELPDDDEIPLWAVTLFNKMKAELCAEIHAKVAYTMKIMLTGLREEIYETLKAAENKQKSNNEECYCKNLSKCKATLAALCASHHEIANEEKKQEKLKKKKYWLPENKRSRATTASSESDTDNENANEGDTSSVNIPAQMCESNGFSKIPPIPPRKSRSSQMANLSSDSDTTFVNIMPSQVSLSSQEKLLNGPTESEMEERQSIKQTVSIKSDSTVSHPQMANLPKTRGNSIGDPQMSPSDSEFEVISMPPNPVVEYDQLPENSSLFVSENDSTSNDECETETELEFKDCKRSSTENSNSPQPSASLYPELELKRLTLSMMSSSSSNTLLDGYVSSCSNEGALALDAAEPPSVPIERQRAPYSIPPEEVKKMNGEEIVHSQPLPSEFLRDRKPYRHVPPEERQQNTMPQQQEAAQQEPSQSTPNNIPRRSHQSQERNYRVDNLPESLWDEALTVAAQTYNAAKAAVENLADTFVPGSSDKASDGKTRSPIKTEQRNSCVFPPSRNPCPVRTQPDTLAHLSLNERRLIEMGFVDRSLNATLLRRYNGDMAKVIADLIEP